MSHSGTEYAQCRLTPCTSFRTLRNVAVSLLFGAAVFSFSSAHAEPIVSGNTISWPDDGWYQVQVTGDWDSDVCQGGTSCEVEPGNYTVINHTTGERWTDILVGTSGGMVPQVVGNTIMWADDGWYQVQVEGDFDSDVCQGGTSCEVEPGTYVVINLTTGVRYEGIVVTGDMGDDSPNIVETAVAAGGFTTLVAALQATGLDAVLADETTEFTVFAPTDDAFALLGEETISALLADTPTLSDILLYHVIQGASVDAATAISLAGGSVTAANGVDLALAVDGESLFINASQVIATDIMTSNGIIHVIDAVLIPPSDETPEPPADTPSQNILEVAEAAGSFTTLLAAIDAAGLTGALNHNGDTYTVFAPTDDAFAVLGEETINALLADPATLQQILLFHVLPGPVFSAGDFSNILGFDIVAGNGGILKVSATNDGLAVNGIDIIAADIAASNGIIHVIDEVLIPPVE